MPETVVGKDQAAYIEGLVCPPLLFPIRLNTDHFNRFWTQIRIVFVICSSCKLLNY